VNSRTVRYPYRSLKFAYPKELFLRYMQSNSDSFLTNEHRAKRYLSRQQSPAMQEEDDDQVFWQDNVPDATRQRDTLTGTSTSVTGNRYYVPWTFISHTHQQDIVPGSASSQYIDTSRSQITYLVSGDEDSVAGTYNLQGYSFRPS
jgi:hypothetical protein